MRYEEPAVELECVRDSVATCNQVKCNPNIPAPASLGLINNASIRKMEAFSYGFSFDPFSTAKKIGIFIKI